MKSSVPIVGVVVVNYNLKNSLRITLRSLKNQSYKNLRIIVVDNGSTDGSVEMIHQDFPNINVIRFQTNHSYCVAANAGFTFALNTIKADYIFSTTNDTEIGFQCISNLVGYATSHPNVGAIGTKIYFADKVKWIKGVGKFIIWHAGGRISWHGHSSHIHWNKIEPSTNVPYECDFVTGCAVLYNVTAFNTVSPHYDTRFGFYCEDSDMCYRMKEAGYKVVYLPAARVWHKVDSTLSKNRPLQLRYHTRNTLYFLTWRIKNKFTFAVHLLGVLPAKMLIFLLLGRLKNVKGIFQGIIDYFKGRTGVIYT